MTDIDPFTIVDSQVKARFQLVWAGRTPVRWPNYTFTPPTNPPADWADFNFGPMGEGWRTIGAWKLWQWTSHVQVTIYCPPRSGNVRARGHVARVFQAFNGQNIYLGGADVIRFDQTTETTAGEINGWWTTYVTTRFSAEFRFQVT